MASTSVSPIFKYDVFLSFRGEDTRKTIVDHLYHALVNKGIITYKDDEKIKQGEKIDDQLIRSIEESRFYIIIFSKNYADSSWCLQELTKIMECHNTKKQNAYPVFYDVEPTEVRNQIGAVGEAFNKHVQNEAAHRWRDALKQAAGLAGWELKNTVNGHEAKFIQKIVQDISLQPHFINSNIDNMFVGMDIRVKNVISSLEIDRDDDVRMAGIWGMGGGGKTTLARAVYDQISVWFEGKSFVENVRECSKSFGLKELQNQIFSSVLNDKSINVIGVFDGKNTMKRMMGSIKVLVVLDDVDHTEQLDALVGDLTWFKPGSRIIITTRDEQVLIAQGVHNENIHDVNLLSNEEAICLLSKSAFKREIPIQGYEKLCEEVVHYAAGLPLTIKVLGSFLYGRLKREWEDTIERLKSIPLKETLEKLELSYNGLENDQKEIFLDIVCVLKGERIHKAIIILESCGFHAQIGLRVLEQKSLLTISKGYLRMHDHIEEMGRNIVRRLHPDDRSRHRRLWVKEDFKDILGNDLGTKATRSMKLEFPDIHPCEVMKSLKKMKELSLLCVIDESKKWKIHESGQYLPNALRSMRWFGYPFSSLPKTFQANNLVNLELSCSNISQLWERGERKVLKKLMFVYLPYSKLATFDLRLTPNIKELDLRGCKDLVELKMPKLPSLNILVLSHSMVSNLNLGLTPNIKELNLDGCIDLVELQMLAKLPKLIYLDLSLSKVTNLNLGMIPNINKLFLKGCKDFVELQIPTELPKLKYLVLCHSKISNLNLGMTPNIERLYLEGCEELVELKMPVKLPKLNSLNLSHSKVTNLILEMTPNIEYLYLGGCKYLVELHMPTELPKLNKINLCHSKVSNLNLGLTPNIKGLYLNGCEDMLELQMPVELPMLNNINLNHSKVTNLNLGMTPNIKYLYLGGCKNFVELQMPMELPKLSYLNLSHSKVSNLNLGLTPKIKGLYLHGCEDMLELQMPVELQKLNNLDLSHSKVTNFNLGMTPNIEYLNLGGCKDLVELQMPVELPKLNKLFLSHSKMSNLNLGMTPNIKELYLEGCEDLVELKMPAKLPKLNYLNLSHSKVTNLILEMTPNIEYLYLGGCKYLVELQMPTELPKLNKINLCHSKVSNLNLGLTPNIKGLYLNGCEDMLELQMPVELSMLNNINLNHSKVTNLNLGMTPNIKYLYLGGCKNFVELQMPMELPKLSYLNLSHSKVSNLNLGLTPNIEGLYLYGCEDMLELQMPVKIPKLNYLDLSYSKVTNLNLGMTPNIEYLYLRGCKDLVELQMPMELPKLNNLNLSHSKVSNLNLGMTLNMKELIFIIIIVVVIIIIILGVSTIKVGSEEGKI